MEGKEGRLQQDRVDDDVSVRASTTEVLRSIDGVEHRNPHIAAMIVGNNVGM